jgi:uncharacterized membrane protein YqjE
MAAAMERDIGADQPPPASSPSMSEAAANVGARALGLLQTRIELASVELAEARIRIVRSLLLAGAALGCALLALMLVTLGIVAWYWDTSRFTAIMVLALVYAGAAALLWQRYGAIGRAAPELFAATLAALRADADQLRGHAGAETPP